MDSPGTPTGRSVLVAQTFSLLYRRPLVCEDARTDTLPPTYRPPADSSRRYGRLKSALLVTQIFNLLYRHKCPVIVRFKVNFML